MQEAMMQKVGEALEDADVILAVTDTEENGFSADLLTKLQYAKVPVIAVLNKVDLKKPEETAAKLEFIKSQLKSKELLMVSATHDFNVKELKSMLLGYLPVGEPFYPKDQMSDLPERFFAAEILREKILIHYQKEVPYSVEVLIEEFRETEKITFIRAVIYVNRHTQKGIIIGHKGEALKKTATSARKDMEKWLDAKVFLEVQVKVKKDWRDSESHLKNFGYL
jgi:GTP-binding protein Era